MPWSDDSEYESDATVRLEFTRHPPRNEEPPQLMEEDGGSVIFLPEDSASEDSQSEAPEGYQRYSPVE